MWRCWGRFGEEWKEGRSPCLGLQVGRTHVSSCAYTVLSKLSRLTRDVGQAEVESHAEGCRIEDGLLDDTGLDVVDQKHTSDILGLDTSNDQCYRRPCKKLS